MTAVTRRALAVLHALIMMSSSINDVFGVEISPLEPCVTHEVFRMYTSCSRTDSNMRTQISPDSFFVTLALPSGTPSLASVATVHTRTACKSTAQAPDGSILAVNLIKTARTAKDLDVSQCTHNQKR